MLGIGMPAGLQPGRSRSGAGRQRLQVLAAVKEKTGKQVVCSKTLVARKEAAAQVQTLCQGIVTYTEDRMRDRTSGIQQYQCMRDGFEDNVFHFYERYASNAHLGRHNTSDEVVKFMTSVQPLLEAPVGMALYEFKNGRLGVAAVQGGPKGEGGLDDATGAPLDSNLIAAGTGFAVQCCHGAWKTGVFALALNCYRVLGSVASTAG